MIEATTGRVRALSSEIVIPVSFGCRLVLKCSSEHSELTEWRQVTSKRGVATFHDISGDPHPVDVFQDSNEDDYWEVNGLRMRRVHVKKRKLRYVPTTDDHPPFDLELLGNQRKTTINRVADIDLTIFDDCRRDGEGEEREQEWTGYTDFSVRRTASMMHEVEEGNTRWVRPRLQDEMSDSDVIDPSTAALDTDELLGGQSTPDGSGPITFSRRKRWLRMRQLWLNQVQDTYQGRV